MAKSVKSNLKNRARLSEKRTILPTQEATQTVLTKVSSYDPPTLDQLVSAVNDAATAARTSWLGFIALLGYLLVTLAGVTHLDLLLNSPLLLPIINVTIPLFSFFIFSPVLLLLSHLWVLLHHVTLRRKLWLAESRFSDPDYSDMRRIRFTTTVVVEYFAGLRQGQVLLFLHAFLTWGTLIVLPLMTLLFFQIRFLPYHSYEMTVWHRICLFIDVALILAVGAYLGRSAFTWGYGLRRVWRDHKLLFGSGIMSLVFISMISLGLGTHPDERARKFETLLPAGIVQTLIGGNGYDLLSKSSSAWIVRNLVLPDIDLAAEINKSNRKGGFDLRGRDLRYAALANSNLSEIDAIGANFDYADLNSAIFKAAKFSCTSRPKSLELSHPAVITSEEPNAHDRADKDNECFDESKRRTAKSSFRFANLTNADFSGASMSGSDFSFSQLGNAHFTNAFLTKSNFMGAELSEVDFQYASLKESVFAASIATFNAQGADFSGATFTAMLIGPSNFKFANFGSVRFDLTVMENPDIKWANLEVWGKSLYLALAITKDKPFTNFIGTSMPDVFDPFGALKKTTGDPLEDLPIVVLLNGNMSGLIDRANWKPLQSSVVYHLNAILSKEDAVTEILKLPNWLQTKLFPGRTISDSWKGKKLFDSSLNGWKTDTTWFSLFEFSDLEKYQETGDLFVQGWVDMSCLDSHPVWLTSEFKRDDSVDQSLLHDFHKAIWAINMAAAAEFKNRQKWNQSFERLAQNSCIGEELSALNYENWKFWQTKMLAKFVGTEPRDSIAAE